MELICNKCKVPLQFQKATLQYLSHDFAVELPTCPVCSQVYISKEFVENRMKEVEKLMEDK